MITQNLKILHELLREHGESSSLSAKKAVWKLKGLDKRLGEYKGTANQISALTKSLKNNPITPAPGWMVDPNNPNMVIRDTGYTATQPIQPAPQVQVPPVQTPNVASQLESANYLLSTPLGQPAYGASGERLYPTPEAPQQPPPDTAGGTGWGAGGTTGTALDVMQQAYNAASKIPTTEETLKMAMESPEYKSQLEAAGITTDYLKARAEAEKLAQEKTAKQNQEKLEQNLAESGLAFSGIRSSQVQSLLDDLATSKLGVDRELAVKLYSADKNLKDALLKEAQWLIEKAQSGKEDAVAQLNKAGFMVVGDKVFAIPQEEEEAKTYQDTVTTAAGIYRVTYDTQGNEINRVKIGEKPPTQADITTEGEEFTRVKQIVAQHPGEWGNAADQIDTEFGKGTATKYDDYLKSMYYATETTILQYKEAGYTRKQIEKMYKDQGVLVPSDVKKVLDEIYK